jgi:hypothetical protein
LWSYVSEEALMVNTENKSDAVALITFGDRAGGALFTFYSNKPRPVEYIEMTHGQHAACNRTSTSNVIDMSVGRFGVSQLAQYTEALRLHKKSRRG